jgi:hypothetical protein
VQYRLVELLRPLVAGRGIAAAELPFRALPRGAETSLYRMGDSVPLAPFGAEIAAAEIFS